MVITRTLGGGEIAFLPGHAPFLGALTENHTRIYLADGTVQRRRRARRVRRGQRQQGRRSCPTWPSWPSRSTSSGPRRLGTGPRRPLRREATDEAAAALRRAEARLAAAGRN